MISKKYLQFQDILTNGPLLMKPVKPFSVTQETKKKRQPYNNL